MTKILLVEDDKSLREIYGVRLLAEGYDIVSAGDGEEALAMAIKERPALIVSDVMMPKISGFDMLDILRSTTETKDIKVIMMTALSSEDQRQRGERLGADRYLVKSQVGIEDVVRTVHEVLGDLPGATPQPGAQQRPAPAPANSAQPLGQTPAEQAGAPKLPQPTAPFSSNTPRPSGLGERTLQPIPSPEKEEVDVALQMQKELSGETLTPPPAPMGQPAPQHPAASGPFGSGGQQQSDATKPGDTPSQPIQRPDVASLSPQSQAMPPQQPQMPQPAQPQAPQQPQTFSPMSVPQPPQQPQMPQPAQPQAPQQPQAVPQQSQQQPQAPHQPQMPQQPPTGQ